jgi:hypothetical protein
MLLTQANTNHERGKMMRPDQKPTNKKNITKILVGLHAEAHDDLRILAGVSQRSMGQIATHAIELYLKSSRLVMEEG